MLSLITVSLLLLARQSLGAEYIDKLLKTHPTWSFELMSAETVVKNTISSRKAVDPNLTEDTVRAEMRQTFGPETTHLARKVGDPKWSKQLPVTFDARKKWKKCAELINYIQDEGACYTDGPVVAASVAADRYCIYTNGTFTKSLSAEMLAGCAESCILKSSMFNSFFYIAKRGIPTGGPYKSNEGCLPYTLDACKHSRNSSLEDGKDTASKSKSNLGKLKPCDDIMKYDHFCPTKCSNPKYQKTLEEDLKKFTAWYLLFQNEFQIRNEIFTYGPVISAMNLYDDFYQYPEKGMYRKGEGAKYVQWAKVLKLIGWGEEDGIKYWLAVNSWDNWGKTKVFKVPRGSNYLFIEDILGAGVYEDLY